MLCRCLATSRQNDVAMLRRSSSMTPPTLQNLKVHCQFSVPHSSRPLNCLCQSTQRPSSNQLPGQYELKGLRWSRSERNLEATLSPAPSSDVTVELILGGKQFRMSPAGNTDGCWRCDISEGVGKVTVFAFVRITLGDQTWSTFPRWIDDLTTLEHASQSGPPDRAIPRPGQEHIVV